MKRLLKIIVVFMFVIFITGCEVHTDLNSTINSDKSATYVLTYKMDEEAIDNVITYRKNAINQQTKETYTDLERADVISEYLKVFKHQYPKYEVTSIMKDGYYGIKLTYKIKNIDDYTGVLGDTKLSTRDLNFEESKMFIKDGDTYVSNIDYAGLETSVDFSQYGFDDMQSSFIVTLPNGAVSSNATEVSSDGKTLTWDMITCNSIEYSFKIEEEKVEEENTKPEEEINVQPVNDDNQNNNQNNKNDDKKFEFKTEYIFYGVGGVVALLFVVSIMSNSGKNEYLVNNKKEMVSNGSSLMNSMNDQMMGQQPVVQPVVQQPVQPVVQPQVQPVVQPVVQSQVQQPVQVQPVVQQPVQQTVETPQNTGPSFDDVFGGRPPENQ